MRLFTIAFDLSIECVESVAVAQEELQEQLDGQGVELVPIDPALIHVPLKVMRNLDGAMVERLIETVGAVATALVPFKVGVGGLCVEPSVERPRLVGATVEVGQELVVGLQKVLDLHLDRIGIPSDPREFRPMALCGRLKVQAVRPELGAIFAEAAGQDFGTSMVRHVSLFDGVLDRHGPRWSVVRRFRLGQRERQRGRS